MPHSIVGTVQTVTPVQPLGPDTLQEANPPNTWALGFAHTPAPGGTKFLMLHFVNAVLPGNNRVEVDLGYDTDVFTSAAGSDFWTRPINVRAFGDGKVPVRYIADAASPTGSVQIDKYGRGERHTGDLSATKVSNCDPFLVDDPYVDPDYPKDAFCHDPPQWENVACIEPIDDVRRTTARSAGMMIVVDKSEHLSPQIDILSTFSLTLVGTDLVLTAGHCLHGDLAERLKTASLTFDYQVDANSFRPAGYNARFFKVKKSVRHCYDFLNDYWLLQIDAPSQGLGVPPITMRPDVPVVGVPIFGVHHPFGAVKKLSRPHPYYGIVAPSNAYQIKVALDVAGGSSGSGLFDIGGTLAGVLSNGSPCDLTYYPTARLLQELAKPTDLPTTRDVMLVFDRSGSMSMGAGTGRSKIEEARDAASLFVQLVQSDTGNRIGLVSFSTAASSPVDFELDTVTDAHKTALIGPAPYSAGIVGGLAADGTTTIGGGLEAARTQLPAGANPRAILLMTDGLQNTPPMIADVDGLAGIDINVIGFGTEASLDGALLTDLAETHNGLYTRAGDGLALRKFFALAFGNIFASNALVDPEFDLPAGQPAGSPVSFNVCGEDKITIVAGWDTPEDALFIEARTPAGVTLTALTPGIEASSGRTWAFLRIALPYGGERDGTWSVNVVRSGRSATTTGQPRPALRYFINVIPSGGPVLRRWPGPRRLYTGDTINPLVQIAYPRGGYPDNVQIRVTVTRPDTPAGNVLSRNRLGPPTMLAGDVIPPVQATLSALDAAAGRPVVGYTQSSFDLVSDPANTGRFEPSGLFGNPRSDLLEVEGNYTFHAVATYGRGTVCSREVQWTVRVDCGIDPARTDVTFTRTGTGAGGTSSGDIVVVPRDAYGNNLGPGRGDRITITGQPGTTVDAGIHDKGDGSYGVHATWQAGTNPGIVIGQPGRPPVVIGPGKPSGDACRWWRLLCLLLAVLVLLLFLLWWAK